MFILLLSIVGVIGLMGKSICNPFQLLTQPRFSISVDHNQANGEGWQVQKIQEGKEKGQVAWNYL